MPAEREVYLNGSFRPWNEAHVHVMSHSFGRGSAIFEVIGFHATPQGPAVFRLDEYVARFFRSAALMGMEVPLTPEGLSQGILTLVRRSGLSNGFLKLYGFYSEISLQILPQQPQIDVAVCPFTLEDDGDRNNLTAGVTACISRWRRLDSQTVPVEAKVAANYVNGIMARRECRLQGFDYAMMLDTQGFLTEGGTESLFLVRQGCLMTPSLGTVLRSITRKSLLEVAEAMGIETYTGLMSPASLDEAEEIFFSGTTAKLIPVRQIGKRVLPGVPGLVTCRLAERMGAITAGQDESFRRWLFPCL